MHQIFEDNGWNVELLRDDSDKRGAKNGLILERLVNQSWLGKMTIRAASAAAAVVDEYRYQGLLSAYLVDKFYDTIEHFNLSPQTTDDDLNGCSHVTYTYNAHLLMATIEIRELKHNKEIQVLAFVQKKGEQTDSTPVYFRIKKFEGDNSKTEANRYAHQLREDIQRTYLTQSQP